MQLIILVFLFFSSTCFAGKFFGDPSEEGSPVVVSAEYMNKTRFHFNEKDFHDIWLLVNSHDIRAIALADTNPTDPGSDLGRILKMYTVGLKDFSLSIELPNIDAPQTTRDLLRIDSFEPIEAQKIPKLENNQRNESQQPKRFIIIIINENSYPILMEWLTMISSYFSSTTNPIAH